jgi:hypothetical protein
VPVSGLATSGSGPPNCTISGWCGEAEEPSEPLTATSGSEREAPFSLSGAPFSVCEAPFPVCGAAFSVCVAPFAPVEAPLAGLEAPFAGLAEERAAADDLSAGLRRRLPAFGFLAGRAAAEAALSPSALPLVEPVEPLAGARRRVPFELPPRARGAAFGACVRTGASSSALSASRLPGVSATSARKLTSPPANRPAKIASSAFFFPLADAVGRVGGSRTSAALGPATGAWSTAEA